MSMSDVLVHGAGAGDMLTVCAPAELGVFECLCEQDLQFLLVYEFVIFVDRVESALIL
jgi:hypothetical protein